MRELARWGRRTITTVAAVALAIGVALVASTGSAPAPPEASRSNDPAAACQDLTSAPGRWWPACTVMTLPHRG
jgi:hypothetical protein